MRIYMVIPLFTATLCTGYKAYAII